MKVDLLSADGLLIVTIMSLKTKVNHTMTENNMNKYFKILATAVAQQDSLRLVAAKILRWISQM